MIVPTKAEMEDCWHNKEVGYWPRYVKSLKKQKTYECRVQSYKYIWGVEENFKIVATDKYTAELRAGDMYRKKHEVVANDYSTTLRYTIREIK